MIIQRSNLGSYRIGMVRVRLGIILLIECFKPFIPALFRGKLGQKLGLFSSHLHAAYCLKIFHDLFLN